jgi:uncharacterized surface protein with fasciclin (FAS1) repeats
MVNRLISTVALGTLVACSPARKDDTASAAMDSARGMSAPAAAPAPASASTAPKDIIETAAIAGTFTTFEKAIAAAGLTETLKGAGPFTVFAPTDEAFAKLPPKELDAILADKAKLTALLKYHVVAGNVTSTQVSTMTDATTLDGRKIAIKVEGGKVTLNGNTEVTSADIGSSNGTIHVINSVLMPPAAAARKRP